MRQLRGTTRKQACVSLMHSVLRRRPLFRYMLLYVCPRCALPPCALSARNVLAETVILLNTVAAVVPLQHHAASAKQHHHVFCTYLVFVCRVVSGESYYRTTKDCAWIRGAPGFHQHRFNHRDFGHLRRRGKIASTFALRVHSTLLQYSIRKLPKIT